MLNGTLKSVLKENMSKKNKNKSKGRPDFIRYRSGNLTGREKNSFERELQRDRFAEEAEEGFEMLPPDRIKSDISSLNRRLQRRIIRNKSKLPYRIAASIAVLMVLSSVFLVIERNRHKERKEVELIEKRTLEIPAGRPEKEGKQERIIQTPIGKSRELIAGEKKTPGKNTGESKVEEAPANAKYQKSRPQAAVSEEKLQSEEIINANMADEAVKAAPSAKVAGISRSYSPPEPQNGHKEFEKYINDNIQRPDTLPEMGKVVVVLNFRVKTDGSIDSLRIVRSPGRAFSEEATRLIKSGPEWKPAIIYGKPVEDTVTLSIVFKKFVN